jgi:uncharacterized integral membrane protein
LRIVKAILFAAVAIFGLSFSLLNSHGVRLEYYLGVAELPLSLALALAFAAGVAVAAVGCLLGRVGRRSRGRGSSPISRDAAAAEDPRAGGP